MKALLRSGLCLALGLAPAASMAQEVAWRGVPQPAAVGNATGVRAVSLSRPVPLGESEAPPRLIPVVRGQSGEEKPLPPGPPLTPFQVEVNPLATPRALVTSQEKTPAAGEKEFIGPPPRALNTAPTPTPSVWGGIAPMPTPDGLVGGDCAPSCGVPCETDCCTGGICGLGRGCGIFRRWCGTDCGIGCDTGCESDCCPTRPAVWASAEYLLWYTRSMSVPPLVTGSPGTAARPVSGVLGVPSTAILLDSIDNPVRSGGRFTLGFWYPGHDCWGFEASYLFLGRRSNRYGFTSAGDPQLARPLVDVTTGNEISQLVAFPGVVMGSAVVDTYTELWGAEANLRRKLWCGPSYWTDFLIGYRHLQLNEGLTIGENLTVLSPTGGALGVNTVLDSFQTRNQFNGGQIGIAGQWQFANRWSLGGNLKLAMGNMHQVVDIGGSQTFSGFTDGGFNGTRNGGILALNSNIGRHAVDRFAVVPEVGLKVNWDVSDHLRLFVGYDFLYVSSVVRPGDQIDRVVNRSRIPNRLGDGLDVGPERPAVLFRTTDFWAQGVNFGMLYHY